MVNQLKEQDELDEANVEIVRLRRVLIGIRDKARENVELCQEGHSQVAEEWCYELSELEIG